MSALIITLTILSSAYGASIPPPHICNGEAYKLIEEQWKVTPWWKRRTMDTWHSPTDKFGQWIIYQRSIRGIVVSKTSAVSSITVSFGPECERNIAVIPSKNAHLQEEDLELQRKMGREKGLIYVLVSPNAPFGQGNWPTLEKSLTN